MPTQVDICNIALTHAGAPVIASLTENSREANVCNTLYDPILKEVMRMHPWGFGSGVVQLAELATYDAVNFTYAYQLPADCLRIVGLVDDIDATTTTSVASYKTYDVRGSVLVTDESPAWLKYVKWVADPEQFDTLFVPLFALRLGATLAMSITKKLAVHDRLMRAYYTMLRSAKSIDAGESRVEKNDGQAFIESRE